MCPSVQLQSPSLLPHRGTVSALRSHLRVPQQGLLYCKVFSAVFIRLHGGTDYSVGTSGRSQKLPKTPLLLLCPPPVGG